MTERRTRFRNGLLAWARENLREYPWRDPDADPYDVFLAEFLLMRTRADAVEPIYRELLDAYPSFAALGDAEKSQLVERLEPLGLQNKRADGLLAIADRAAEAGLPDSEDALLTYPYVGRYVANATLCFGFGEPRPIVDANVYRVYSRVFGDGRFAGPSDDALWDFAAEMLPDSSEATRLYNLGLLDLGALVCTPRSPECEACPVNAECAYYADRE